MFHTPQYDYDTDGVISPVIGFISSMILNFAFLDFAQNLLMVFVVGAVGAAGGWTFNFVRKWIEKKIK